MNIKFKFLQVYEQRLNEKATVISWEKIEAKINFLEEFWKAKGKSIEKALNDTTGFSFVEKEIVCYLNSGKSFSEPLTIKIEDDLDTCDNLVHELIHVLLTQNEVAFSPGWKALFELFRDETKLTKVHIAVHAIHYLIARKITPERIDKIENYSTSPDYIRSWNIVKTETPQKITDLIFK